MNWNRRVTFAVVLFFLCGAITAQTIVPVGVPGHSTGPSAIAAKGDARAIIAFINAKTGDVEAASCIDFVGCQALSHTIDDRGNGGKAVAAAMGNDGLAVIAYFDSDAVLHVAKCLDSTCATSVVSDGFDTGEATFGGNISIAIGLDGNPVIAYYHEATRSLQALMCTDPNCAFAAIEIIDDGPDELGRFNDVAIGADGHPVFSYYVADFGALKVARCVNTDCDIGGTTVSIVDDPPATDVGFYTSIAISELGFPLITYHDRTNLSLKLLECRDAGCNPATVEDRVLDNPPNLIGRAGEYSQLVIPSDGIPVVAYRKSNSLRTQLAVARCVDTRCTALGDILRPDRSSDNAGSDIAMALGRGGLPLMSYFDFNNLQLYSLRCDSLACDVMFGEGFEEQPR